MTASFAAYRTFAPADWEPPQETVDREAELLGRDDYHAVIAEDDGTYAGHSAWWPADQSHQPGDDPGLAHLRHLFVAPGHWGTGLAVELLRRAVDDARAGGFARLRLHTPQLQARARRFYEREGFTTTGVPIDDPRFGMAMLEYRRSL